MTEPVTTPGTFAGVTLPFTPADLVSSGNELLGLVGAFVLLGMAFVFVPKIIRVIRSSFGSSK